MIRAMRASDGIVVPARQILRYLPMARAVLTVDCVGNEGKVDLSLVGESPRWSIELLENTYTDRLAGAGQGGPNTAAVIKHLQEQLNEIKELHLEWGHQQHLSGIGLSWFARDFVDEGTLDGGTVINCLQGIVHSGRMFVTPEFITERFADVRK